MMTSNRFRLLDDALHSSAFADVLTATRRAARQRRIFRRSVRVAGAAVLVITASFTAFSLTRQSGTTNPAGGTPAPAFVLINTPASMPAAVRTGAVPAGFLVSTPGTGSSIPRASKDDLFASAGARPAGLHQLPDGSARWMWLDEPAVP